MSTEGGGEDDEKGRTKLEFRDYVALAIAALETVLLPLVVLIVILLVFLAILR